MIRNGVGHHGTSSFHPLRCEMAFTPLDVFRQSPEPRRIITEKPKRTITRAAKPATEPTGGMVVVKDYSLGTTMPATDLAIARSRTRGHLLFDPPSPILLIATSIGPAMLCLIELARPRETNSLCPSEIRHIPGVTTFLAFWTPASLVPGVNMKIIKRLGLPAFRTRTRSRQNPFHDASIVCIRRMACCCALATRSLAAPLSSAHFRLQVFTDFLTPRGMAFPQTGLAQRRKMDRSATER